MALTFSCTNSGSSNVEEFVHTYPFTAADAERMIAACNQYGAFDWAEVYGGELSCEAGESFWVRFRDGTDRFTSICDEQPPNYQQVLSAMFYPDENAESSS